MRCANLQPVQLWYDEVMTVAAKELLLFVQSISPLLLLLVWCSHCGVGKSHLQVEVVSSSCAASPQMQATISVLQLPPRESFST